MARTQSQREALRHPIRWLRRREPEQPGEIPRRELSGLTLGLMGQNHIFGMAGGDRFFHFCTNVLGLDPVTVGTITGATALFDGINDPIAGAIVDRTRFKDGRKLMPWLKLTSPAIGILSFLLFINWGFSTALAITYCVIIYVLWDIAYSFQDAALWGMTAAIHEDTRQRARTIQWADIGVFLGGLLPSLTMPMLGSGAFGLTQGQTYFYFALFLCLGGGFQALFTLNMTERMRSLPETDAKNRATHPVRAVWQNIIRLRHNHILLLFLAIRILESITPNVADIFMFQHMENYNWFGWSVHPTVLWTIFVAVTGFPGAALKPFALKITDRVGSMKRVLVIGRVTAIITRVLGFLVGVRTPWGMFVVALLEGISHLPNSLFNIAQRALLSDSVEYVEWKTGYRTEGITMSVRNFMAKFGGALRRYVQGVTLNWLQYDAAKIEAGVPQTAHFNRWIWPVFRMGPVIGFVLSMIPLLLVYYPDSLREEVEGDLAQRRAAAELTKEAELELK